MSSISGKSELLLEYMDHTIIILKRSTVYESKHSKIIINQTFEVHYKTKTQVASS